MSPGESPGGSFRNHSSGSRYLVDGSWSPAVNASAVRWRGINAGQSKTLRQMDKGRTAQRGSDRARLSSRQQLANRRYDAGKDEVPGDPDTAGVSPEDHFRGPSGVLRADFGDRRVNP